MKSSIERFAPAKINLQLAVLGKRSDGFHELGSLMAPLLDLKDVLQLSASGVAGSDRAPAIQLTGDINPNLKNQIPSDFFESKSNLIYRAADLFLKEFGDNPSIESLPESIHIHLEKNIPLEAGLGGGSSDAASVLLGLNDLLQTNLPKPRLKEVAAEIGSDITFFIEEAVSLVEGRGEHVEVLQKGPIGLYVLVLKPFFGSSTKEIFGQFDPSHFTHASVWQRHKELHEKFLKDPKMIEKFPIYNDLDKVHSGNFEHQSKMKKEMLALGAETALMAGSGSSVVGIFSQQKKAKEALLALKDLNLDHAGEETLVFLSRI